MSGAGQRVAVGIEYDGSRYAGWQAQPGLLSVQSEVEAALSSVADQPVSVTCAGRTDAGVHATGQVAHFDTGVERPMRGWVLGANSLLPADIALRWAAPVAPDFHARYTAEARSYEYLILEQPVRPALERLRVCWLRERLDEAAMHDAAQCLAGEHDFSAFRGAECQARTPLRRVERIAVRRDGDVVALTVTANAFLHHMVRNIAGTLIEVGTGEREPRWVATVLDSRDRRRAGVTAPACGLYLRSVRYPAGALPADLPAAGHRL